MTETGYRPSEIFNILPEHIILNVEATNTQMRSRSHRQLKGAASSRDIPLVGFALEAVKNAPNDFPCYRNKRNVMSKAVMDGLKIRGLQPTPGHHLYSLRHSYEKRMQEAVLIMACAAFLWGIRTLDQVMAIAVLWHIDVTSF